MLYFSPKHIKNIASPSQMAIIEHKRMRLWKDALPFFWIDFKYEISNSLKRKFIGSEFNIKISAEISHIPQEYYAHLNMWKMFLFKRMFGIHWTQQPEWIRFILGLIIGFVSGYMLWFLTQSCPPCK